MKDRTLPRAEIGSIGGSGTWGMRFPEDLQRREVSVVEYLSPIATPYGLSCPLKLLSVGGQRVLRVAMHGQHRDERGESVPTWTCALQVAWIYQQAGVQWVLVDGSVGGIQHPQRPGAALPPWSVVIPDDFIQHWIPPTTARLGSRASRLREPLCGGLRTQLVASARRQERFSVVDGGVYVCTPPGRFETAAEIRMLAGWGAHIVGQTLGHEAPLMRQLGIHLGSLNIVSNYAEGNPAWGGLETMERFYRACAEPVGSAMLDAMLSTIETGIGACHCGDFQLDELAALPVDGA